MRKERKPIIWLIDKRTGARGLLLCSKPDKHYIWFEGQERARWIKSKFVEAIA